MSTPADQSEFAHALDSGGVGTPKTRAHALKLERLARGLRAEPKQLSRGVFEGQLRSGVFERIRAGRSYYLARTELEVLTDNIVEIASALGQGAVLIESDAGQPQKADLMLSYMHSPAAYVPVGRSSDVLVPTLDRIATSQPDVLVRPVVGDVEDDFVLPKLPAAAQSRAVFLHSSALGRREESDRVELLASLYALAGQGGGVLLGVDLHNDAYIIEPAYNDLEGFASALNLSTLRVANELLDEGFDIGAFRHRGVYLEDQYCLEMRLYCERAQTVVVAGERIALEEGAYLVTERAHKFDLDKLSAQLSRAGFTAAPKVWKDPHNLYALVWCPRS